jgi:diguanylate cyclase (GGDEF)-like protein
MPAFIDSIAAARQEFQALLEITQDLDSSLRVDETLALLASRLKALIPHHFVAIYTVEGSHLATRYAAGEYAALFSALAIPLGEGISGWVVQNSKSIVNENPSVEPGYLNDPGKYSVHRSALSVPLPGIQGVIGALTLYHREGGAFTKDHSRVLMAVSSKVGRTIENALRFVAVEETAATDNLTGLPNTRTLFQRLDTGLQDASRRGGRMAIVATDMDGFKTVNDQFGHAVGNLVLQKTAEVLKLACRKGDCVARMGGDEFVLLLADAEPVAVGERIHELDRMVADVGTRVCGVPFLRLSAGAAFFPEDGRDPEELLAKADARMYEMKRRHHAAAASGTGLLRLAEVLADPGVPGPQFAPHPPRRILNPRRQVRAGAFAATRASNWLALVGHASACHPSAARTLLLFAHGVFVEDGHQFGRHLRHFCPAAEDLFAGPALAVEKLVLVQIVAQGGAIDGGTGEQSLGARPGKDLGAHKRVRLGGSSAAHGTRRRAGIGADRKLTGAEPFHAALIHDQHHHIGGRDADLKAEAAAFDAYSSGRTPSVATGGAANGETAAVLSANAQGRLFEVGDQN